MNRGSKPPPLRLALWIVAILSSLVVAPVYGAPANAPTPGATDGGQSYFVTWFGTGKGSKTHEIIQSGEHMATQVWTTTLLRQGSALVKFDRNGLHRSLQIISNAESYQSDYSIKSFCSPGPHDPGGSNEHWHSSLIAPNSPATSDPYLSRDFTFVPAPPHLLDDGSWEVQAIPPSPAGTFLESDTFQDICGPAYGIKRWLPPSTIRVRGYYPGSGAAVLPSKVPDWLLKSTTPDSFSGHFNWVEQQERGPPAEMEMDWTVTVRRIGKCRIPGLSPLNDQPPNPDITGEEIDLGVEYGKSSIDPNDGIAPLNLRVTCDGIPIKNAFVDVKVDPQKNTGGHMHDSGAGRPRGSLNGIKLTDSKPSIRVKTDDDGRAHLTLKPGKAKNRSDIGIAGIYQITANTRFPAAVASVAVTAETKGLDNKATGDTNYVICRPTSGCPEKGQDADPKHMEGTWSTPQTVKELAAMAKDFTDAQNQHNAELDACHIQHWTPRKLRASDMSLPMGGLLDISGDWQTPHISHGGYPHGKLGAVDFSVNAWSDQTKKICCYEGEAVSCSEKGWLAATMANIGMNYGGWDKLDLCQHPNTCSSYGPPYAPCCGDNATCPPVPAGGAAGPPNYGACPGPTSCLHCVTDPLWHLWFNQ